MLFWKRWKLFLFPFIDARVAWDSRAIGKRFHSAVIWPQRSCFHRLDGKQNVIRSFFTRSLWFWAQAAGGDLTGQINISLKVIFCVWTQLFSIVIGRLLFFILLGGTVDHFIRRLKLNRHYLHSTSDSGGCEFAFIHLADAFVQMRNSRRRGRSRRSLFRKTLNIRFPCFTRHTGATSNILVLEVTNKCLANDRIHSELHKTLTIEGARTVAASAVVALEDSSRTNGSITETTNENERIGRKFNY